jgi:hypothetical protein
MDPVQTAASIFGPHQVLTSVRLLAIVTVSQQINKKLGEELIAYFPLVRHGPHRKQGIQNKNYGGLHRQKGDLVQASFNFLKIKKASEKPDHFIVYN